MEGPAGGRGLWSQSGVPHKGWVCVGIDDLGSPDDTCQMCQSKQIRYVHHMEHPDYPNSLDCGCVCAGHMEGSLAEAEKREAKVKSVAGRRKRWLTRKWKISRSGNDTIKTGGFRVTVFLKPNGWGASVTELDTDTTIFSRRRYGNGEEAKMAAFNAMIVLEARR